LKDGAQIYVPSLNENEGETTLSSSPTNPTHPRININTAAASDLELLPGIGPSLAQKIIEFRQENGPFETIEDLLDVSGIRPSKLEEIRDHVTNR
jgi:competence protein ComEA